ncbi:MAG TPA: T9SS type A sorting domain-containing protein [Bacteroidales bacterium]|nr:T9SS type A sorting domain-containing protein [Bacteroidales bacterium]
MKRILLIIILFVGNYDCILYGQHQTNTPGSDIAADAPYRMRKSDTNNQINSIPLHVYVHSSSCFNCGNELNDIKVYLKNASDQDFGSVLTFENYSFASFDSLITSRSPEDLIWGVQAFDSSGYATDNESTIRFTSDESILGEEYVDISEDYWYFTLNIPPEKLTNYEDILDIKIYFTLDFATDQEQYFRVFRYDDGLPRPQGWYRGDTHYHSLFTQNDVEFGLPLEGTKEAAKKTGLDWITLSDHSCDFNNYGSDMQDNWYRQGLAVMNLNSHDSSFIFIRAMEASIKNSEGKVVHALLYPSEIAPFSYPFFLDGGGDLTETANTVPQTLADIASYIGFAYCAHPFAEKEELSFVINGGTWNLNDTLFPADGQPHPSMGTVICNDLSLASDIYSNDSNYLFPQGLAGGEIWNNRQSLSTTDEENDPWNVTYSGSVTPFVPLDIYDPSYHFYRFMQNLDVTDFLQKKALHVKNNNPSVKNWKFFISAGSDAHGSFNYSNTGLTFGITGDISDNAIGKLATMAYCPDGMGVNGRNVLKALKNGNTVLSDGPVVIMGISTDGNSADIEINIGQDTVLTGQQLTSDSLVIDTYITPEFGNVSLITLTGITQDTICFYELPVTAHQVYNLNDILIDLFGYIPDDEYFTIRASMRSIKYYGTLSTIYRRVSDEFFSITNPIWIKPALYALNEEHRVAEKINVRPNPVNDRFYVNLPQNEHYMIRISDVNGAVVLEQAYTKNGVDVKNLPSGIYIASFYNSDGIINKKIIVNH